MQVTSVTARSVEAGQRTGPRLGGAKETRARKRSELIAEVLRREIVAGMAAGTIVEGDPLPPEKELVERFSVARPTLREAMRILESYGIVEFRVGKRGGTYVRTPRADVAAKHVAILLQLRGATIRDLWEFRAILEPSAVRLIAQRPTKRGVLALRRIVRAASEKESRHAIHIAP